jgi:hypothetical protein
VLTEPLSDEDESQELTLPIELIIKKLMPTIVFDEINTPGEAGYTFYQKRKIQGSALFEPTLSQFLCSHLVSETEQMILPVWGVTWYYHDKEDKPLHHPFYPYEFSVSVTPPVKSLVTRDELMRLEKHSSLTQHFFLLKKQLAKVKREGDSLLARLTTLSDGLYLNSKDGVGSETEAGVMAQNVMQAFWTYYSILPQSDISRLPEGLVEQIHYIRKCLGKYEKGEETLSDIETCLATRRTRLLEEMNGHDALLSRIGANGRSQEKIVDKLRAKMSEVVEVLCGSIETAEYQGCDSLGIKPELLSALEIKVTINDFDELLFVLNSLMPDEIMTVFSGDIQLQALKAIKTIDNLCVLFVELPKEKISALLEVMGEAIFKAYVKKPKDISVSLMVLNGERAQVVAHKMRGYFHFIIRYSAAFRGVFLPLSAELRAILFHEMLEFTPSLICSPNDFNRVVSTLDKGSERKLIEVLGQKVIQLVSSKNECLESLYDDLDKENIDLIIKSMMDYLALLIQVGDQSQSVVITKEIEAVLFDAKELLTLSQEKCSSERRAKLSMIADKICCIRDGFVGALLNVINTELEHAEAIENILIKHVDIIFGFANSLDVLFSTLEPSATRLALLKAMLGTHQSAIQDLTMFLKEFDRAAPKEKVALLDWLKAHLDEILRTEREIGKIIHVLAIEEIEYLGGVFKNKLIEECNGGYSLIPLSREQTEDKFIYICELLRADWDTSFFDAKQYYLLFSPSGLSKSQVEIVLTLFEENILSNIKTIEDVYDVLVGLSVPHRKNMVKKGNIINRFSEGIESIHLLVLFLSVLEKEDRKIVFYQFLEGKKNLECSSNALRILSKLLEPQEVVSLYQALGAQAYLDKITNALDYANVLEVMPLMIYDEVISALKLKIAEVCLYGSDIAVIIQHLAHKEAHELLLLFKEKTTYQSIFPDVRGVVAAFTLLNSQHGLLFIETFRDEMAHHVRNPRQAYQFLCLLLKDPSPVEQVILDNIQWISFNQATKCVDICLAVAALKSTGGDIAADVMDEGSALYQALNTKGLVSFTLAGKQGFFKEKSKVLQAAQEAAEEEMRHTPRTK